MAAGRASRYLLPPVLLSLPFGVLFGFVGSMPLAGPIALLVFGRGLRGAYRSGLAIAGGSAIAESGYAFLAYWGMAQLVTRFPRTMLASRALAALVLIGLGLYLVLHQERPGIEVERVREHPRSSLALGFAVTAFNPTFIATWTAAVTVLHSLRFVPTTLPAAMFFAVGVGCGIFGWFAAMLWLMRRWRERFHPATLNRLLQAIGLVLAGMGVWSAASLVYAMLS
ncbi:MAG: LysE family transporter [Deltaproteobacteria bacterium]|nr:LysE family transporter [Deltaproteobacteria bacterium]